MTDPNFWQGKRILVTGGAGFIGSYVVENLIQQRAVQASNIIIPRKQNFDLSQLIDCQRAVEGCQIVIHLAARTGGISFTRAHPAQQYYETTLIDLNMIEAARQAGVEKFIAIGNLFAYAATAPSPLDERDLFDGLPTDAHRSIGWMKRNLALMADLYYREYKFPMVVVYSANAYGPRDSLDPVHSHVIPATIMKCFRDPELIVWGDGSPTRDFLFAADIAEGLLLAAEKLKAPGYVNLGSGKEISVRELIELIVKHTNFKGKVVFDASKSGGDARRCSSVVRAREIMGFEPQIPMDQGLERTVAWYREKLVLARS